VDPPLEYEAFCVHQQIALSAFDLLGGVEPRSLPRTPVVLTDWESTMPALGWGSLWRRTLTRWRRAE
jgi:hypothetical protein